MTTIAYKNHIIAWDSRSVRGSTIISDNCNKHYFKNSIHFWGTGTVCSIINLINFYLSNEKTTTDLNANLIAVKNHKLFLIGFTFEENLETLWEEELDLNDTHAFGSGASFAYTAMDMGANAIEAVKMACKRDIYSGGEVNIFQLNEEKKMPYTIKKGTGDRPWKIINKETGKQVGSSKTKKDAESSARARLAGEHKK